MDAKTVSGMLGKFSLEYDKKGVAAAFIRSEALAVFALLVQGAGISSLLSFHASFLTHQFKDVQIPA